MAYNYNKLRGRIVEKYGSQEKFSNAVGISSVAISKKMRSITGFSQDDIVRWSALLDIDLKEVSEYFFDQKV